MLKQSGRRFGPAPKHPVRTQAPAPMSAERRSEVYGKHWTARQHRQFERMHSPARGSKGGPTPKRAR